MDQGRPSPLSGPVFRSVDRWGRLGKGAVTGRTVANVVKDHAEAAGLDPTLYAGHSLRAGFATTAARARVSRPPSAAGEGARPSFFPKVAELVLDRTESVPQPPHCSVHRRPGHPRLLFYPPRLRRGLLPQHPDQCD